MTEEKKCTKCYKSFENTLEWFPANKKFKSGLSSLCRHCTYLATKSWKKKNGEREKTNRRRCALKQAYGLSLAGYEELLKSQGGGCRICGRKDVGSSRCEYFHVDHDHISGKIRGLLCNGCNRGLGYLQDSPELILKALNYLKESLC